VVAKITQAHQVRDTVGEPYQHPLLANQEVNPCNMVDVARSRIRIVPARPIECPSSNKRRNWREILSRSLLQGSQQSSRASIEEKIVNIDDPNQVENPDESLAGQALGEGNARCCPFFSFDCKSI
jgi:hypothetical protein